MMPAPCAMAYLATLRSIAAFDLRWELSHGISLTRTVGRRTDASAVRDRLCADPADNLGPLQPRRAPKAERLDRARTKIDQGKDWLGDVACPPSLLNLYESPRSLRTTSMEASCPSPALALRSRCCCSRSRLPARKATAPVLSRAVRLRRANFR